MSLREWTLKGVCRCAFGSMFEPFDKHLSGIAFSFDVLRT